MTGAVIIPDAIRLREKGFEVNAVRQRAPVKNDWRQRTRVQTAPRCVVTVISEQQWKGRFICHVSHAKLLRQPEQS